MADITLAAGTRPKAAASNSLAPALLVTNSNNDSSDYIQTVIAYEDVTPSPSTIVVTGVTVTNASAVITKTNAFALVKVGDPVTGTGIPANTKVLTKTSDSSLTLTANATATGTPTLTFTPPVFDANLFVVRKTLTMQGSNLLLNIKAWKSDGVVNKDVDANGADDTTVADYGEPILDQTVTLDLDKWLTSMRVARAS